MGFCSLRDGCRVTFAACIVVIDILHWHAMRMLYRIIQIATPSRRATCGVCASVDVVERTSTLPVSRFAMALASRRTASLVVALCAVLASCCLVTAEYSSDDSRPPAAAPTPVATAAAPQPHIMLRAAASFVNAAADKEEPIEQDSIVFDEAPAQTASTVAATASQSVDSSYVAIAHDVVVPRALHCQSDGPVTRVYA